MAGIGAGHAFSDWPTYGGRWLPVGLYDLSPWWINHFENPALVHVQHRTVGYLVAAGVIALYAFLHRSAIHRPLRAALHALLALTMVQIALGVATVLAMVPLALAALHQVCALLLFGTSVWLVYVAGPKAPLPSLRDTFPHKGGR